MSQPDGHFDVHDKVLREIVVRWDGARAELLFNTMRLVCTDVSDVHVPCALPWGRSVHANRAEVLDGVLFVEMQSGDTIAVRARAFEATTLAG